MSVKIMVARKRFELLSAGPEPAMLGRYTTGLIIQKYYAEFKRIYHA